MNIKKMTDVITFEFNKEMDKKLSASNINKASTLVQKSLVARAIVRTLQGFDRNSNSFKGYSKSYARRKKDILKNKYKGSYYAKLKAARGTYKYSASSVNDKIRLSGELLGNLSARQKSIKVNKNILLMKFEMYVNNIKSSYAKHTIAQRGYWLEKQGYKWFGSSRAGKFKTRDQDAINKIILKALGFEVTSKGVKFK